MKLHVRTFVAMGPLILALCVVGLSGAYVSRSLARQPARMLAANYHSIVATSRMNESLSSLDRAAVRASTGGTDSTIEIRDSERRFESALASAESNITEPGEAEAIARLRADWGTYLAELNGMASLPPATGAAHFRDRVFPAYRRVHTDVETVLRINQDAMNRKGTEALRRGRRFELGLLVLVVLFSVAGVLAAFHLTRRLLRPLSEVSEAMRRFGKGDGGARALVDAEDEIGVLAREFNALADHLERYRKSSLGELLRAQHAAQAAIDGLTDPVVLLDGAGKVHGSNRAAATDLGIDVEAAVQEPLQGMHEIVRSTIARQFANAVQGRQLPMKGFEDAVRMKTPSGERVYLPQALPILGESGELAGAAVVFQDITRVFQFDELKSNLVSTVAHEFRTPLTSLRMAIHLCLEQAVGPLTEKQADLLTAGREDCERLQRMVDDLLDLSRLESGRIELQRRKIPVEELLSTAVAAHRAAAETAGLSLRMECLPGLPELFVDADRLDLVFANMVTNAIRYSPAGSEIVLAASADAAPSGWVRFEIRDEGPGIPTEHQGAVFEKFFRVPGSPSGGAGLGLFIARGIVVSHGGDIGAANREGKGAVFWFTLPVDGKAAA